MIFRFCLLLLCVLNLYFLAIFLNGKKGKINTVSLFALPKYSRILRNGLLLAVYPN